MIPSESKIKKIGLISLAGLFLATLISCLSKKKDHEVHSIETHPADVPAMIVPKTSDLNSYTGQDAAKDLKETFDDYQKAS